MDNVLRLSGKVTNENKWVKLGSHHTVELGIYKEFTLWKHQWDEVSLMRLEEASAERARAQAAAIVMQEGVANICLMTDSMTLTKAHITQSIPRKRKTSSGAHDKSVDKFYQVVYESMLRIVDFKVVKAVLIASPGFIKDQFFQYINTISVKTEERAIIDNKSKFMLVHANSGHRHALNEILRDPAVVARLSDTKAAGEVAILTKFNLMLAKDDTQAVYSKKHVQIANESGAIEDLLLSDNLFRARNVAIRREYIELVESVKAKGGNVHIFSSLHVSGEQLAQYSGVAAILRFPLPEILEDEEEEQNDGLEDDAAELDENDPSNLNQEENPFGGTSIQVDYEDDEE
jgi:protein pelota